MLNRDSQFTAPVLIHAAGPPSVVGKFDPEIVVQMALLVQTLVANSSGRPLTLLFTGSSSAVGTTTVVRMLREVSSDFGYTVGSVDLTEPAESEVSVTATDAACSRKPVASHVASLAKLLERDFEGGGFDLLIIDAPPIAGAALPMCLASRVDGVVLVIEADRSTEREIQAALQAIRACSGNCRGIVMNHRRRSFMG